MSSDASNIGWGTAFKNDKTGGNWSIQESKQRNISKALAAYFALKLQDSN